MTRVLIIEDHRVVAQGLELGLRAEDFEVGSTDGNPDSLRAVLAAAPPDIVLLDLYLAGGRSGISLMPMLRAPDRTVIVLTGATDPILLARALDAGADAFLGKAMPFAELVREIRAIREGRAVEADRRSFQVRREARAAQEERARSLAPFAALTRREEQVLAMLLDGVQAAEIAERSYVSLATVRSQIRSILTKLGVGSQLTAVSMAIKAAWAPGDAGRAPTGRPPG